MDQPVTTGALPSIGRVDHLLVAEMIAPGARVLDVGCGDGALLRLLAKERGVDGRGIEISQQGVNLCVAHGLSVIQGDADTDLVNYPDDAFDYVILSQTLQTTLRPRVIVEQMLRIGDRAVVSFPNFGHWRTRLNFLTQGRMPVSRELPYEWYDTPNVHFCTIRDFALLCKQIGATIEKAAALDRYGGRWPFDAPPWMANIFGQQAVFLLRR